MGSALAHAARTLDAINEAAGRFASWLALALLAVVFAVVVLRYAFGVGFVWLQESAVYLHALLFLLGAGYTLRHDGHVRVDVLYAAAAPRMRAWIDLIGALVLLVPVMALILWIAWPYVAASWAVREGSRETSGIPAVFLLKTAMLVFAGLVLLQGVSLAVKAAAVLTGERTASPASGARGI